MLQLLRVIFWRILHKRKLPLIQYMIQYFTALGYKRDLAQWESLYGEFDKTNYGKFTVYSLSNESKTYTGDLFKWAQDVAKGKMLLAGDDKGTAKYFASVLQCDVKTAGLGNVDYQWNFENAPPKWGNSMSSSASLFLSI